MSSASSSDSSVLKTSNINYKTVTQHPGKYRYLKVPLNNVTGNQITLDAVSSTLLEFKLPATVYNLSKSLLNYNIELPAPAAKGSWAFNDTLEIAQSVVFTSSNGVNLVDLQYVNNYVAVARKIDTSNDEYLSGDQLSGLVKADVTTANYFPPSYTTEVGNIFGITTVGNPIRVASTGLEPQYVRPAAAVVSKMEIQRSFPLSGISGTLFSMPQDQFFGADNMYLRIMTAPSSKVGYIATSVSDPVTGAAVLESQPVIKNIYLYLAIEKDQMIVDSVMEKYHSGQLKYTMPFTTAFRATTVGAGTNALSIPLNVGNGKLLKRMLVSSFPASETLNSAYDHCNWSGAKITSYRTYVDSQPLQDDWLNCVQPSIGNPLNSMDDFRENRSIIKRAGPIMGPSAYQLNWFHCDKFAEPSADPSVPDSQVYDGLDLSVPKAWSMQLNTTAANYTHYCWAQLVRQVVMTANGPQFEL